MTVDHPGDSTVRVVLVHVRPGAGAHVPDGCERALVHALASLRARIPCHVTALAVGRAGEQAPWLHAAARSGCDRLMCVVVGADPVAEDTGDHGTKRAEGTPAESLDVDQLDYRAIAELAAAALSQLESDVIVCATYPPGGCSGVHAPALAHALDRAHLSDVVDIQPGPAARELIVVQRADSRLHRWRCALPVVLSVWAAPLGAVDADAGIAADAAAAAVTVIEYLDASGFESARAALSRRLAGQVRPVPPVTATIVASPEELLARLIEDRSAR